MFCKKCGAQIEEGMKFCRSCGSPIEIESESAGQNVNANPQPTPVVNPAFNTGAQTAPNPGAVPNMGQMAGMNGQAPKQSVSVNIPGLKFNIFNLYNIIALVGILFSFIGMFCPFIKLNLGLFNSYLSMAGINVKTSYMTITLAAGWLILLCMIASVVLLIFGLKVPALCVSIGEFALTLGYPLANACNAKVWESIAQSSGESYTMDELSIITKLFGTGAGFWLILIGTLCFAVAVILDMILGEFNLKSAAKPAAANNGMPGANFSQPNTGMPQGMPQQPVQPTIPTPIQSGDGNSINQQ